MIEVFFDWAKAREIDSSMELFGIAGAAGLTTIERWPSEAVRSCSYVPCQASEVQLPGLSSDAGEVSML
jgi:hypothetical protein